MPRHTLLAIALTALAIFTPLTHADRPCSSNTSVTPSYTWRITDLRYDGMTNTSDLATLAVSLYGDNGYTLFECVSQWPAAWGGWYRDSDTSAGGNASRSIIWSDCTWTGNGPRNDTTVSFAADWRSHTMYLSHTWECADRPG
jgi:hypothetical protein